MFQDKIPKGTVQYKKIYIIIQILTLFSISSTSWKNLHSQLLFFASSNHFCNSSSATGEPCSPWPVNVASYRRKYAWWGNITAGLRFPPRQDESLRVTTTLATKIKIILPKLWIINKKDKLFKSSAYQNWMVLRSFSKQGRKIIYNNLVLLGPPRSPPCFWAISRHTECTLGI